MKIVTSIKTLRQQLDCLHPGKRIGFVPTMGYFHQGHISLMEASVKDNDVTVVSLFVNPIQFGPQEDMARYPRDLVRDRQMAKEAQVDFLFVPLIDKMYPELSSTFVDPGKLGDVLCGAVRHGHFRGVTTVVAKLLNIVRPDMMYLGQKDAQQVEIIRRMLKDLNFSTKIHVCPIIRERDGLAMSSRNAYLSSSERAQAPALYKALCEARKMVADGERNAAKIISKIKKLISVGTNVSIEYVACVGADDLISLDRIKGKTLIAAAVRVGTTRLIDNIIVKV